MLSLNDRLLCVDVETTGPNPAIHDPLAVALVPMRPEVRELTLYIRPPQPTWTPYGSDNFHRFETEWARRALDPAAACHAMAEYLQEHYVDAPAILVGHNVGFDLSFIRKLAALGGLEEMPGLSHRTVDTHTLLFLAWLGGLVPEEAMTSDGAFGHFDIRVEGALRHTALGDAIATRELYGRLIDLFTDRFLRSPAAGAR